MVAWFTAYKSWTGWQSSIPNFWSDRRGMFQVDWQGLRIPYLRSLSRCLSYPIRALWGIKYCFWQVGPAPGFSSVTTGDIFQASPGGLSLAHTPGTLIRSSGTCCGLFIRLQRCLSFPWGTMTGFMLLSFLGSGWLWCENRKLSGPAVFPISPDPLKAQTVREV